MDHDQPVSVMQDLSGLMKMCIKIHQYLEVIPQHSSMILTLFYSD